MTEDNKKKSTDKISGIGSASKTQVIKKTTSVDEVQAVKATSGVSGVQAAGSVNRARKATTIMSAEERDRLLKMIDEEAESLLKVGAVPASQKELIKKAVKMAVDSGIVLTEDLENGKNK